MPRRTDDLISIALGESPGPTKTSKSRRVTGSPSDGEGTAASVEPSEIDAAVPRDSTGQIPAAHAEGNSVEGVTEAEGQVEVRPIGTSQGLRELADLYRKTGGELGALERKVHMMLWPLALHFGLYWIASGQENKRPPLVGAFWARSLAEAPLTLGHLYPPALFKGLLASDVYEFGGMAIDPEFRQDWLIRVMSETTRLFLFSRRPELIIATPIESLHELYKRLGLKTIGTRPVDHPHVHGVKVYLMYGKFKEMAGPYFM
jgi:hypothetical protein